jgi:hypothetical protein
MNLYKLMLSVVTLSLCLDKLRPPQKEVSLISHSIGSQLSDEDYQLSEVNQLGTPLDIYRLKPGYIRFLRITGLLIFIIGVVSLVFIISQVPDRQPDSIFFALPGSLYALFQGGVFYSIMARQARSMRVIVCEKGLLQVRKIIRRNKVEVMRWNDIRAIKRDVFRSYYIVQQGKGALTLTLYQKVDELVELIKQRSGVA